MRTVLTFLSDFGSGSPYPAAMKAAASGITDARFIDITHEIPPHDIIQGSFTLWSIAPHFPEKTVHCAVVDPDVGTARAGMILSAGGQLFVGPDNGLLSAAASRLGEVMGFRISESSNIIGGISSTFHGRDIFAPVAAQLANGIAVRDLGSEIRSWSELEIDFEGGSFDEAGGAWIGQIVSIDRFGNLITNIRGKLLEERAHCEESLRLAARSKTDRVKLHKSYGFAAPEEPLLLINSVGLLEIAVARGSAKERFDLDVGAEIRLSRDD